MASRVVLRAPQPADEAGFVAAARASRRLHHPWVSAPATPEKFQAYLARMAAPGHRAYLVCRRDDAALVGVFNVSNAIMGGFRSAYLGYYAFAGQQGQGLMREGLQAVLRDALGGMGLHRLEANIQPGNAASIALVQACGFRREGYSERYLKIGGRWRDHERWAVLRAA